MLLCTRGSLHTARRLRREGYVLLAVLIVIVVLSLMAYRFTDSMGAEYRAAVRTTDIARSRAAALSGIHYAASLLSNTDSFTNTLNSSPTTDNPGLFSGQVVWTDPKNSQRQAQFTIVSVAVLSQGNFETRNAVIDEGGKLNINALITQDKTGVVLYNALMKLPNMTEDIAAAIVDWVDADDNAGSASNGASSGAEDAYYMALANPYHCKNGPLNSLDELLLVKGVTPQLLYGSDQNQNGLSDEANGTGLTRGWSDYLTINGRTIAVDSTGQLKIWINGNDDPQAIYTALQNSSIGEEMAAYIMAAKLFGPQPVSAKATTTTTTSVTASVGKNGKVTVSGSTTKTTTPATQPATLDQLLTAVNDKLATTTSSGRAINSIMDLANTQVALPASAAGSGSGSSGSKGGKAPQLVYASPLNDPNKLNQLLPNLLDQITTKEAVELIPRLNVNTAQQEVIAGLPGLTDADVSAIMSAQSSLSPTDLSATTGAWLVTSGNLPAQKFKALENYVTGASMVYRIQAIGYVTNTGAANNGKGGYTGPVARFEAVVDTNFGNPRFLSVRDLSDLDNPRGFQPTQTAQSSQSVQQSQR
jgi:type II secretory pathway component PulK